MYLSIYICIHQYICIEKHIYIYVYKKNACCTPGREAGQDARALVAPNHLEGWVGKSSGYFSSLSVYGGTPPTRKSTWGNPPRQEVHVEYYPSPGRVHGVLPPAIQAYVGYSLSPSSFPESEDTAPCVKSLQLSYLGLYLQMCKVTPVMLHGVAPLD